MSIKKYNIDKMGLFYQMIPIHTHFMPTEDIKTLCEPKAKEHIYLSIHSKWNSQNSLPACQETNKTCLHHWQRMSNTILQPKDCLIRCTNGNILVQ